MNDSVECHSEHAYAERPTFLTWQGERLEIIEIRAWGRTPEGRTFRVCTRNRQVFDLIYREASDDWRIQPS